MAFFSSIFGAIDLKESSNKKNLYPLPHEPCFRFFGSLEDESEES
jgi:hypothetical protein